jgi:hypothetical protein
VTRLLPCLLSAVTGTNGEADALEANRPVPDRSMSFCVCLNPKPPCTAQVWSVSVLSVCSKGASVCPRQCGHSAFRMRTRGLIRAGNDRSARARGGRHHIRQGTLPQAKGQRSPPRHSPRIRPDKKGLTAEWRDQVPELFPVLGGAVPGMGCGCVVAVL